MRTLFYTLLIGLLVAPAGLCAQSFSPDSSYHRYFVGSSAFMLVNLVPDQTNPPDFVMLNGGYWLNQKNTVSLEAITWKYNAPLGIPYGDSYESEEEKYPGYIRCFGLGVAYQHFWWKRLYTGIHATPMLQRYFNEQNEHIQNGFQVFCTARAGYHFALWKDRFYIEPSIAMTFWPVQTNMPEEFQQVENRWPSYFIPEPGLHLGVKF